MPYFYFLISFSFKSPGCRPVKEARTSILNFIMSIPMLL
nr:MAG TPA: hypothetical protein [Caudoviricetes sp.]